MAIDLRPNIRIPTESFLQIEDPFVAGLAGLQSGLQRGRSAAEALRKRRAQQLLASGLQVSPIEGVPSEVLQGLAELSPTSVVDLFQEQLRGKRELAVERPFGLSEEGQISLRDPKSALSAQEAQVVLRQKSLEGIKNKVSKQMDLALARLAAAKTAQERQAAQAIVNSLSDVFLKVSQPELFGELSALGPSAVSTLGGLLDTRKSVTPSRQKGPITDTEALIWLKQNYPQAKATPADIKWAKEQIRGRR